MTRDWIRSAAIALGRMRSRMLLFAALTLAAYGVAGASDGSEFSPRVDYVIAAYYPPLMIDVGESAPGISIEIIREAARRQGRKALVEFLPFPRALKKLRNDESAMQAALYRNETREPLYRWIVHTHDVEDVFLTMGQPINSLEEARALDNIGVEQGASMDVLLTRLGFTNLERVAAPDTNAQKLMAGRIDAWALTRVLALHTWRRSGFRDDRLVIGAPIQTAPVYIVAHRNFPADLAEGYRKAVESMKADGTVSRILESYE